MLKAFDNLSSDINKPNMTIISGKTQILFDKNALFRYNKEGRITFNEEDSLEMRPDRNYVKKTKRFFPGTLISIKFVLQKDNLEKLLW